MRGFYSSNLDPRFYLLLNYGVYLAIRVVSTNITELTTVDHDDIRSVFLSSAYLFYQLALKLPGRLMAAKLGIQNLSGIQNTAIFKDGLALY